MILMLMVMMMMMQSSSAVEGFIRRLLYTPHHRDPWNDEQVHRLCLRQSSQGGEPVRYR